MTNATWDLYIGFPIDIKEETKQSVIDILNTRHPDCTLTAIVDGYWSNVREDTFQVQFKGTLKPAQTTVKIIQAILDNGFVTLCEAED